MPSPCRSWSMPTRVLATPSAWFAPSRCWSARARPGSRSRTRSSRSGADISKARMWFPWPRCWAKVRAAVDTRRDGDFQIVARTDARAVLGLDAALERAQAMIAAGADATFVEAPTSRDEIGRILRELPAPQIVNIVFGGRTPEMPRADLAAMGAGVALYANAALQAAIKGAQEVLGALKRDGSLATIADRLASFEERQRILRKDHPAAARADEDTAAAAARPDAVQSGSAATFWLSCSPCSCLR